MLLRKFITNFIIKFIVAVKVLVEQITIDNRFDCAQEFIASKYPAQRRRTSSFHVKLSIHLVSDNLKEVG